jgi:hypothetical protein
VESINFPRLTEYYLMVPLSRRTHQQTNSPPHIPLHFFYFTVLYIPCSTVLYVGPHQLWYTPA